MYPKTKEFWQELKLQHKTAQAIAAATNIKYQTVVCNFNQHDIPLSSRAERLQRNRVLAQDVLEAKYLELNSGQLTADFFGLTFGQVINRIPQIMKDKNARVKYLCDESFFDTDTPESLYVAGLIAADGCLHVKDGRYKQVSISLKEADLPLIEKCHELLKFEGPIYTVVSKNSKRNPLWNDSIKRGFTISSDRLFDALVRRFEMGPRKSLTLKFPDRLINHPLVRHFLLGYWDGDGTIGVYDVGQGKTTNAMCGLRGTPDFLLAVRQILEREAGVNKRGDKPIQISGGQGKLEYGGNLAVGRIRDFLYNEATIFMERKKAMFYHPEVKKHRLLPKPKDKRPRPTVAVIAKNMSTGDVLVFSSLKSARADPRFLSGSVVAVFYGKMEQHRGWTFTRAIPKL